MISLKSCFSCCFELLKKEQTSNFNEIALLKLENLFRKIYFSLSWWSTLLTNFCYDPSGIYHSGSNFFIALKRSQKTTINFGIFVTGVKHTSWCLLRPWFRLKDRLINQSMNHEPVYRTAPATPGLLMRLSLVASFL